MADVREEEGENREGEEQEENERKDERREEGDGEAGRRQKGRLIQERDRVALALVGMNRVVRERTLQQALFPGRDDSTFANRVWELARDLKPVGPYWTVHRRILETGAAERYLSLTDVGFRQAEQVLGAGWFERRPTEPLKPSHIGHDLELADFALSLLPRRSEFFQPRVRGRPIGEPVAVEIPRVPTRFRWKHASVFQRLTVLTGKKDSSGKWMEKPTVAVEYEPDAILETDAFNCTRYFVEWDRGTEPLAGRETRTILDKLRRIAQYFWIARKLDAGPRWFQRGSYYLDAFPGDRLRRPKILLVTTSAARVANIWRLAERYFRSALAMGDALETFFEVLTVEDALRKLSNVIGRVETSSPPAEWPWVAEGRALDAAAAKSRAEATRRAQEEARRDPLWVPYAVANEREQEQAAILRLGTDDGLAILAWADELAAAGLPIEWRAYRGPNAREVIDLIRGTLAPSLAARVGISLKLAAKPPDAIALEVLEVGALLGGANAALDRARRPRFRSEDFPTSNQHVAVAILGAILFHYRIEPRRFPLVVAAARAAWGNRPSSPWAKVVEGAGARGGAASTVDGSCGRHDRKEEP